ALGCEQRHTAVGKVAAQLRAKQRPRANAGAVDALVAPGPDAPHQLEVRPLPMVGSRGIARLREAGHAWCATTAIARLPPRRPLPIGPPLPRPRPKFALA